MRLVYFFLLMITMLASCESKNAKTGLPFTKDSLMGNWMAVKVTASLKIMNSTRRTAFEDYRDSVMEPIYDNVELAVFQFQPGGVVTVDDGHVDKITGNWLYNDKRELLLRYKYLVEKNRSLFSVEHYWHDSLQLENVIPRNRDTMYVTYFMQKLRTNDSVPNLFDPALNKWREKPLHAEDPAAIKTRLKQVLYYYSAYFANISGNRIPVFNIRKILCPILFYNGGIGLQKFNKNDEWKKVFYDNSDAQKAHAMLSDAFSKITNYPDKAGDYVKEYVVALKLVADAL
ncbi:hypothetical protein FAM09_25425 [Niastella caeni]|uniref:Lipoprotein n=1 Tax=Niastella caeni TaxID=2569763 RepID=A0A4S8HKU1_9BACT|nr:hypothetical protein [Niastella caeni]THU33492.1 hypothetical protein FAM09_25425 [Niastella caeni]